MNNGSIGQSVNVKGDLTAQEDLTIDGHIDGTVTLDKNVLTVGHHGTLKATVLAKTVIVQGKVTGNITATDTIRLHDTAEVQGDLVAPKVGIADGASFSGTVDMRPPRVASRSVAKTGENQTPASASQPAALTLTKKTAAALYR